MAQRALALLVLMAAPGLVGCGEQKTSGQKIQAQVNLPEPPKLAPLPYPEKYDGGLYSVVGIRRAQLLHRGPKVMETDQGVRGFVVEHYENPCKKTAKDCLGKEPHFWIADATDSKVRLTVVPSWKDDGEAFKKMFEVGKQYDFKGRFTVQAGNGYADNNGLLNIDCPPEICPVDEGLPGGMPGGLPGGALPPRPGGR